MTQTKAAKPAAKDATLSLLGGLMSLKIDVLPAKLAEERVSATLICPDTDEPTRPVQMYVHPDDLDTAADQPRMWKVGECDKAREIDGVLYRIDADELAEAKEPLLPTGEIGLSIFPAGQVESVSRPSGTLYRLRPKATPAVYTMLVALIADRADLAFVGELTIRGTQRMYRCESWGGHLVLQEMVRPGEFYDAEPVNTEYDSKLLDMAGQAIDAQVEDFDPEAFKAFLRDRAVEFDAVKRDPNAPAKPKVTVPKAEDTASLMALLEGVAATAKKAAPKKGARKAS